MNRLRNLTYMPYMQKLLYILYGKIRSSTLTITQADMLLLCVSEII